MALMNCPECGKEMSDKADKCPNCGYPLDKRGDEKELGKLQKSVKKKSRKKLLIGAAIICAATITGIFGYWYLKNDTCVFSHEWEEAACEVPMTCARCGKTEGDALGHDWQEATCEVLKTCARCGKTEGELLEHEWEEATCVEPKICKVCGKKSGKAKGHTTKLGYCSVCGEYVSELADEFKFIKQCCDDAMDMYTDSMDYLAVAKNNNDFDALRESNEINHKIRAKLEEGMQECDYYEEFSEIKYQMDMAKSKIFIFDDIKNSPVGVYSYVVAITNSLGNSAESLGNAYLEMKGLSE